jgi:radical SAM superfamily enzyme YgiQ (UPF0313 family)
MINYHGIIFTDAAFVFRTRPLGAYTIASTLRKNGYNILVVDFITRIPLDILKGLLDKFITKDTLFLGYGSTSFNTTIGTLQSIFFPIENNEIDKLNSFAKKKNENIAILLGGAKSFKFLRFVKSINNNLNFTHVMHGLGDVMIIDFVKCLENKTKPNFSDIQNGIYVIDHNKIAAGFDFKNNKHSWHDTDFIAEGEALPLNIGNGCIFKCKFCAYPLIGKDPRDTSYIKDEEILLEEVLENYDRFKTLTYLVVDDTFNERTEKINLLIKVRDRSKLNLNFTGYNRIDLIARNPEQLNLLKDANFNGMFFGIESLNYASAKSIGKGIRPEEITETLYKIKDKFKDKINLSGGFIIGLPHESPETFYKWWNEISKESYPLDNISLTPLGIQKTEPSQSDFFKNPELYGYSLAPDGHGGWSNSIWDFEICTQIFRKVSQEIINNSRQKSNNFMIASLTALGYNFEDVVKTPRNFFDSTEFKSKFLLFVDQYIKKLSEL